MRKKILLITLFLLISSLIFQRVALSGTLAIQSVENLGDADLIWSYTYGENMSLDAGYSIIPCSDGGFLLAGSTGTGSATDVLLIRLNETGSLEWTRRIESEGFEVAHDVIECDSGGFAIIGYRQESWAYGTTLGCDALLIRIDDTGSILWSQTIGGNRSEQAYSLVGFFDGSFAFAGYATNSTDNNRDFWLVRTNSTGHLIWSNTFGDERNETCYSMIFSHNLRKFVMVGTREIARPERQNGLIVTATSLGVMIEESTISRQDFTICYDVVSNSLYCYTVAGTTMNQENGQIDAFIITYESSHEVVSWDITLGGIFADQVYSVLSCRNGGYVVSGCTQEASFPDGRAQFWLARISADGVLEWSKSYGGFFQEIAWSVVQTSNNDFILAGTSDSHLDLDIDVWVIRVPDSPPVGIGGAIDLNLLFLGVLFGIAILAGVSIVYFRSRRELSFPTISMPKKHLRSTFFIPRTLQELSVNLSGIVRCRHCGSIVRRNQMTCPTCSAQLHRCLFCDNIITDEALVIFCPNCRNLSHAHEMHAWLKIRDKCPICRFRLKS